MTPRIAIDARREPLLRLGACVLALLAAAQAVVVVQAERKVGFVAMELHETEVLARSGHAIASSRLLESADSNVVPRGRLMTANTFTLAAAQETDVALRNGLLDQAHSEALAAARVRPAWGEAWAIAAFSSSLRLGDAAPLTRREFERSYSDAPYLRHAAAWRIAYAFRNWQGLSKGTRARSIAEAVWLARIDKQLRDRVFLLGRQSEAYIPLLTAWRASRLGDVDYVRSRGFAP